MKKISPPHESVTRILQTAKKLFAQEGFNGLTTRKLAEAVGLNIATIHHHVGSKGDLYQKVLDDLYQEEKALIEPLLEEFREKPTHDAQALKGIIRTLIDTMLQKMVDDPARPQLYMRRWMEVSKTEDAEATRHAFALFSALRSVLREAQLAGIVCAEADIDIVLRSFDWISYGYFVSGPVIGEAWRADPRAPENLERFRQYLYRYFQQMLGIDL